MDLAKIRQKARRGQGIPPSAEQPEPIASIPRVTPATGGRPEGFDQPPQSSLVQVTGDFLKPDLSAVIAKEPSVQPVARRNVPFDPIKIILAGRQASGCDEDTHSAKAKQEQGAIDDYEELLCIRVSDEIYGINIMKIKEIIKPREVTEIPRTPSFVSGVISLRGVIIPIIDIRDRLGLSRESVSGKERVVVIRSGDEFAGLMVDEVIQVSRISRSNFEAAPAVLDGINRDFVSAIGRADERMVIVLNLDSIADINLY